MFAASVFHAQQASSSDAGGRARGTVALGPGRLEAWFLRRPQEFSLDTAEDVAEVLSLTESVAVPYGSFNQCLKTKETSPLEPDVVEHKFYAWGVGNLLTIDLTTGERLELVKITRQ